MAPLAPQCWVKPMLCPAMLGPLGGASSRRKRGAKFTKGSRWFQMDPVGSKLIFWSLNVCLRSVPRPWSTMDFLYVLQATQKTREFLQQNFPWHRRAWEPVARSSVVLWPLEFLRRKSWGMLGLDTSPTTKATPSLNFPNHNINTPQTLAGFAPWIC